MAVQASPCLRWACVALQVVFVHVPSGTLIATDLIWNYPSSYPKGTSSNVKLWKFGMDRVYLPFYRRCVLQ